ncbi:MAG: ATP-binding protein [Burkholderiales bacterium]
MRPGFRLVRVEVLNWGTFHGRVWRITPNAENALLTGDIGSGKSTLVDAITSLLVSPRRITFNKAAGAEARERTLASYVRGEYRSIANALTGGTQAQALRAEGSYSTILGVFEDRALGKTVTLAQVFWINEAERQPGRFYVVAPGLDLTIADAFTGFGEDIQALKKRLRANRRLALFDSFEEYGARLRRELGISQPQALDLFYQTVSMKKVDNITDFVRQHMLEDDDTVERIRALIDNFENLNRAHEAVVRARQRIEALTPIATNGDRLEEVEVTVAALRVARESLAAWFAGHRVGLLITRIEQLGREAERLEHRLSETKRRLEALSRERGDLRAAIELQGGARIREIEAAIARLGGERVRRQKDDDDYRKLCVALGVRPATTLDAFVSTMQAATTRMQALQTEKQTLDREAVDRGVEFKDLDTRTKSLAEEIQSLRRRASNIPVANITIRDALAEVLGKAPDALPFAGELLQVRPDEAAWEGAIERLMHGLGLSLLVSESLYPQVSHYVNRTHLHGRLVYLRVRDESVRQSTRALGPQAVARKLSIKPDSGFYPFLERELREHFDHACCDDLEEFSRMPRAITRAGQIKTQDRRHEKDDRHPIDDRARYVLGWDNRAKLKVLETELGELRRRLVEINKARESLRKRSDTCELQMRAAAQLATLDDFARIDWRSTAGEIEKLADELRDLETSNDQLRTLREHLNTLDAEYTRMDAERDEKARELGTLRSRIDSAEEERARAEEETRRVSIDGPTAERLASIDNEQAPDQALDLRTLDSRERRVREALQGHIDSNQKTGERIREHIVRDMQRYKEAYPAESVEMDARTEALPEYRRVLQSLADDDLPRFEARFKDLLNKETINSMAAFQAHLQKRRHEIEARIRTINESLAGIEYDRTEGTYIQIVAMVTADAEVRDFQTSLRACISDGDGEGALYTEQKFLQVKALVERLAGRAGQSDQDQRWRDKVTDVRNWFEFGASERWRADSKEREFYRDSSGKSGGQKEKLAYTILAAALAYQFGLGEATLRRERFRFVMIDEAFGRGSDESTRYGLELFGKLDLQLLIVTPLQKIAVIEDYIAAVHFVHNEGGANSMVQNLSVEEYRQRKLEFARYAVQIPNAA